MAGERNNFQNHIELKCRQQLWKFRNGAKDSMNDLKTLILSNFPLDDRRRALDLSKKTATNPYFINKLISKTIEANAPALIGRIGVTECQALTCILHDTNPKFQLTGIGLLMNMVQKDKRYSQLNSNAGVYPIDATTLKQFASLHIEAALEMDVFSVWAKAYTSIESTFFELNERITLIRKMTTSPSLAIDNDCDGSWAQSLIEKKVLVISPFVEEFEIQVGRIDSVFPDGTFPKADYKFIKAPITQGGKNDGKDWIKHLNSIKEKMSSISYDVTLISAGSYAMPLAAYAKSCGKVGINCGGELQLFFGVGGSRWQNNPRQTRYFNDFWIRPFEKNRPKNWLDIENGCYW